MSREHMNPARCPSNRLRGFERFFMITRDSLTDRSCRLAPPRDVIRRRARQIGLTLKSDEDNGNIRRSFHDYSQFGTVTFGSRLQLVPQPCSCRPRKA
jgi:hypothetical protein